MRETMPNQTFFERAREMCIAAGHREGQCEPHEPCSDCLNELHRAEVAWNKCGEQQLKEMRQAADERDDLRQQLHAKECACDGEHHCKESWNLSERFVARLQMELTEARRDGERIKHKVQSAISVFVSNTNIHLVHPTVGIYASITQLISELFTAIDAAKKDGEGGEG